MRVLIAYLLVSSSVCLCGQNSDKLQKLRTALEKFKIEKNSFESHLEKLVHQLKARDSIIEKQINSSLDFLTKFKDSNESNYRIIRNKEKAIKDLRKSIDEYAKRRQTIINELKYGNRYFPEDMKEIKDWLDKKIELRVQQILKVTKSLDSYKDHYDRQNNNHYNEKKRVERADREKQEVIKKMNAVIAELQQKIKKLEREFENPATKYSLAGIADEIAAARQKIELLENSINEVWTSEKEGKKVGNKASLEIDRELRKKVAEIKGNAYTFFKQFDSTIRILSKRKDIHLRIDKYEFAIQQLE